MNMTFRIPRFGRPGILSCTTIALLFALTACNDDDSGATDISFRKHVGNAKSVDNTVPPVDDDTREADDSDSGDTESSMAGSVALESMATGDVLYYEGQGRGPLAGARFTTPDGSVFCHVSGTAAACVPTSHIEWPLAERVDIVELPDGPSDTIGWFDNLGIPYAEEPRHWQRDPQGFPAVGTGSVLADRVKLEILTHDRNDSQLTVTCGSVDNVMTCSTGPHGFTIGLDTYHTW